MRFVSIRILGNAIQELTPTKILILDAKADSKSIKSPLQVALHGPMISLNAHAHTLAPEKKNQFIQCQKHKHIYSRYQPFTFLPTARVFGIDTLLQI